MNLSSVVEEKLSSHVQPGGRNGDKNRVKPKRALLSLYNKAGSVDLAKALLAIGCEIIASTGTYTFLVEHLQYLDESKEAAATKKKIHDLAEFYGFKSILGGRVKTLHAPIHGGILHKRDDGQHLRELQEHGMHSIDLVCINLYPFAESLQAKNADINDVIEMIDIGGPALIRSTAKNFLYTTALIDVKDYAAIVNQLKTQQGISLALRQELAVKAFAYTAEYDALIESALAEKLLDEERFSIRLKQHSALRYGENPHQEAALYETEVIDSRDYSPERFPLKALQQTSLKDALLIKGSRLSYNNHLDGERALESLAEFPNSKAAVVIKHGNPCGLAKASSPYAALAMALEGDIVSRYGSIIAVNFPVEEEILPLLNGIFVEILIAPSFTKAAIKSLEKKKKIRLLQLECSSHTRESQFAGRRFHSLNGAMLRQSSDDVLMHEMRSVTKKTAITALDEELYRFSYKAARQLKSNAIAIGMRFETKKWGAGCFLIGMGAGQANRVDAAVKLAIPKMIENKQRLCEAKPALLKLSDEPFGESCVLASDAFFPFKDSIDPIYTSGLKKIIQPGGSIRDDEVIKRAEELGMTMIFTGTRHFRH